MIFADKLIELRKKMGWSQEQLAEQMNVTRQSVSKWEGAQSVPDLEKIIRLSELFGVSIDFLLKDEIEMQERSKFPGETLSRRRVSVEEADTFLSIKESTSKSIANATFLCILSPICLFVLGAASGVTQYGLSENKAGGIGMIILLAFVASAVAIFISSGSKTAPFEYLEKEIFETEYGVSQMVKERKEKYKGIYTKNNIIGSCLCIMSLIPLFGGVIFNEENDFLMVIMLSTSFIIAGIGVRQLIRSGIVWASYEKLLQEGEYSKIKKEKQSVTNVVSTSYWLIVTAVYLGYSLSTDNWEYSWIVWVIAGALSPVVINLADMFGNKK